MHLKLALALSLIAMTPTFAAAQKGAKPTMADVQKVISTISSDKTKMQAYCDMGKLNEQMVEADKKKDKKALQTLGKQADDLAQKLGPDYAKVMQGMEQVDEKSAEAKQFSDAFEALDKQCK